MAEINLGAQRLADFGWTLEVKPPLFILTDQLEQKRFEVQDSAEILALLGGEGANKTSTT